MALSAEEKQAAFAAMDEVAGAVTDGATEVAPQAATEEAQVREQEEEVPQAATEPEEQEEAPEEPEGPAQAASAPEEKGRLSKQWAQVQRQQRELQSMQLKVQEQQQAMERQKSEVEETMRLLRNDPASFVQKHGGHEFINSLTQAYGADSDPVEYTKKLEKKLEDIEKAQNERWEKKQKEEQSLEAQKYVQSFQNSMSEALQSEELDLVESFGHEQSVMQVAGIYARDYGQELTAKEAAAKVQEELRNEYLPKIAKTRSLQEHYRANAADFESMAKALGYKLVKANSGAATEGKPRKSETKTLTSSMANDAPVGLDDDKVLDRRSEVSRALALIQ